MTSRTAQPSNFRGPPRVAFPLTPAHRGHRGRPHHQAPGDYLVIRPGPNVHSADEAHPVQGRSPADLDRPDGGMRYGEDTYWNEVMVFSPTTQASIEEGPDGVV